MTISTEMIAVCDKMQTAESSRTMALKTHGKSLIHADTMNGDEDNRNRWIKEAATKRADRQYTAENDSHEEAVDSMPVPSPGVASLHDSCSKPAIVREIQLSAKRLWNYGTHVLVYLLSRMNGKDVPDQLDSLLWRQLFVSLYTIDDNQLFRASSISAAATNTPWTAPRDLVTIQSAIVEGQLIVTNLRSQLDMLATVSTFLVKAELLYRVTAAEVQVNKVFPGNLLDIIQKPPGGLPSDLEELHRARHAELKRYLRAIRALSMPLASNMPEAVPPALMTRTERLARKTYELQSESEMQIHKLVANLTPRQTDPYRS
ncbi:hypothetical protein Slin14017_G122300 [Septoria linicola]|nr:hypothetical protein Slin14017_G122300 [Septoria linicola]